MFNFDLIHVHNFEDWWFFSFIFYCFTQYNSSILSLMGPAAPPRPQFKTRFSFAPALESNQRTNLANCQDYPWGLFSLCPYPVLNRSWSERGPLSVAVTWFWNRHPTNVYLMPTLLSFRCQVNTLLLSTNTTLVLCQLMGFRIWQKPHMPDMEVTWYADRLTEDSISENEWLEWE